MYPHWNISFVQKYMQERSNRRLCLKFEYSQITDICVIWFCFTQGLNHCVGPILEVTVQEMTEIAKFLSQPMDLLHKHVICYRSGTLTLFRSVTSPSTKSFKCDLKYEIAISAEKSNNEALKSFYLTRERKKWKRKLFRKSWQWHCSFSV